MTRLPKLITECPNCHAFVEYEIHGEYSYSKNMGGYGRYLLTRCINCNNPLLLTQDNIGNLVEGDIWSNPTLLFPNQIRYINPDVLKNISTAFSEAQDCLIAKAYTATAIMARKTLDGICAVEGIKSNNLVNSLKILRDKGVIDTRLFEWADELRLSGNEAAHDVDIQFTEEDAKDIVDFTAAILDYIYSFRNKFETFKERRQLKKSNKKIE